MCFVCLASDAMWVGKLFLVDSLIASGADSEKEMGKHSSVLSARFAEGCPPSRARDAESIRARFVQFESQSDHDERLISSLTAHISRQRPQSRLHLLWRALRTATEIGPSSRTVQEQHEEAAVGFLSCLVSSRRLLRGAAWVPLRA